MSDQIIDTLKVVLEGQTAPYVDAMFHAEAVTDQVTNNIISLGTKMSLALTTSLGAISAASVTSFAAFDDNLTKSTAIMSGITAEVRQQMADVANTISTQTVTAADKLAESYYFLASAGLDAQQSMASLATVNNFAIAGAFDMARATDLITDAQSALGLTVKDTTQNMQNMNRVADVLIKANVLANASAEQFAISLTTKSAAALRGLNKDIEEGVAVLAAYADQGVKAQLSGEKLTIFIRETQRAVTEEAEAWSSLGLSVYDTSGRMLPLVKIIEQLESNTKGLSDAQVYARFTQLGFRSEAMDAIKPLIGMSEKIKGYEEQLRSAGGVTEEVANRQMTSFSSQMKIFKNNLDVIAQEIGSILAPSLLTMNEYLMQGVNLWHQMTQEQKVVIVTVGKVASVMGPLLLSMGVMAKLAPVLVSQLASMSAVLMTAFTWIRTVALVAALPFIKVIAIVGAVIAAVYALAYAILGPEGISSAWKSATGAMSWFFSKTINFLANLTANIAIFVDWFKSNWQTLLFDLGSAWLIIHQNMIHNVLVMIGTMIRLYVAFLGWLTTAIPEALKYVFSIEFAKAVYEGIQYVLKAFTSLGQSILSIHAAAFTGVYTFFKSTSQAILTLSVEFAKTLGKAFAMILKGQIPDPVALATEFMSKAIEVTKSVGAAVGNAVGAAGEAAAKQLAAAKDQIEKDFNAGASDLNFFNTAGDILAEGIGQMKGPLDGFKSELQELPDFITDSKEAIVDGLVDPLAEFNDAGVDAAGFVGPLQDVQTAANSTAIAVENISKGFEAASQFSAEANKKVDDYFASLTSAANGAANAANVARQGVVASNAGQVAGGKNTPDSSMAQRQTMIGLLNDIKNNTSGFKLEAANI